MTTRREFMISGACALGGLMVARRAEASIKKVGLQLYTVRNELAKDFRGTLERVAAIGFKEVEFAGYAGQTPQQVKATLRELGLEAPSGHVPLAAVRDKTEATLDEAAAIGHRYVVVAWLGQEERQSIDDYRRHADVFNRVGEEARKRGLRFAYHNHDFEFVRIGDAVPYDLLLERTDPKMVALELDLYWIAKGGHDPLAYFAKYPGRFPMLHVKDMERGPGDGMVEVGRGRIDFKKIFERSRQAGVEHYFVEHDNPPGSPFDSVAVSYEYLKKLRF